MRLQGKKMSYLGIMTSLGIMLSYIENLFVIPVKIPGIKVGLSNVISVMTLYIFGPVEAFLVLISRVILSNLLFGSGFSLLYSISGALISLICMICLFKTNIFSCVGVSVVAGVAHNIAQLIVAIVLVENVSLVYYLPILILAGVIAGMIVGSVSSILIKRLKSII